MKQISDEEIEIIKYLINERKTREAYKILDNLTEIEVKEIVTKEVNDGRNI